MVWHHRTLFETFNILAEWTWMRREQAKAANLPFSEESITESILLDLQIAEPHRVKVVSFSKFHEAKTGADWEWCFFDHGHRVFFPVRVQAKLLDDRDKTYAHLNRCIGNSGVRQIDRLLQANVPAIYVFYNHLRDTSLIPKTCMTISRDESWGCSFALASAVRPLADDKTFEKISKISRPWACMVCCGAIHCGHCGRHPHHHDTDPLAVHHMLESLRRHSVKELDAMDLPNVAELPAIREPTKEPPNYFRLALSPELSDEDRGRMAFENPDIAGTVLVGPISERAWSQRRG
jgi:hypothetical protein